MEKCYVAKLEESSGELVLAKLVDIQFARRPPTFGTLHLAEVDSRESITQQSLKLNTLELANDQSANFTPTRDINLTAALLEAINQRPVPVIDFNTLNGQLLLEVSHSSTILERLRSSCFVLTQAGDLCVISLIDQGVKLATSVNAKQPAAGERFVSFELSLRRQENVLDHELASKRQPQLEVHVLSEQTYYHYNLRVSTAKLDCDVQLLYKYCVQANNQISRSLRFVQFRIIRGRGQDGSIILLQLNDNSRQFVKNGKCLQSIDGNKFSSEQSEIVALPASVEQETILLEYFNHKLVAYSLLIGEHAEEAQLSRDTGVEKDALLEHQESSDPDGLLPRAPSFELEECWSFDLTEIDGIRSKLMSETEAQSGPGEPRNKLNGCLCPLWPPETGIPSSMSKLASRQDDESMCEPSRGSPKFLLVSSYSHLLLFCFEHEEALPFSVVYDRAFLDLVDGGSDASNRLEQRASAGKSIELKLRPKLVFNFKLIGQSPLDSLLNLLFLTQKIRLAQVKHFSQLGLFVSLTNEHHVLAFKLHSEAVIKHKDNLYQQSLVAALRKANLLADEIQRVESMNAKLVEQLAALEAGHGLDLEQSKGATEIESLIQVTLRPDELIGGLYNLLFVWPAVADFTRIVVTSNIDLKFLSNEADDQKIRYVKSNDCHHLDERLDSLECGALFLDLEAQATNQAGLADGSLHQENSIKAWSIVELNRKRKFASSTRRPFAEESLSLPLFLLDGQQLDGLIRVYFVSSNPLPPGFDKRNSSLPADLHLRKTLTPFEDNLRLPCKFIKCQVQVKAIQAYRQVEELEESLKKTGPVLELGIRGPFSDERILSWLNACLELQPSSAQNQARANNRLDNLVYNLYSNFSHCFISVRFASPPHGQNQQSEGEVTICSDDFIALTFIERHLFKRATDDSIRLIRPSGRALMVSIDNLRHLIARQQLNIDLYQRLSRRHVASNNDGLISGVKRSQQVDLLLECIMGEALDLQSLPIKPELKQSNLWLERSFHQDLEQVVGSEVHSNKAGPDHSGNRLSSFLDMIFGYIIDALVDYDRLHQINGSTPENMMKMRSKLTSLIRKSESVDQLKFVERVLEGWSEIKSTDS